ncbi:hypothetical protein L7H23_01280 [Sphingopyxis sp. BSN-002]|uniref:hypothetical protein n=1 Tax=Sphingopyxis sp. BSN-002 TaxID=2911495 RepID=UPI001EDA4570|nr:hypothetical protein [Sphingopyxis sp. BSN-002]QVJ07689.1 hypothetical protein [Sphingopyxis phage VSN-002]UKK84765.1 hypothetical protein L7H23_01280 [Sphingopyxis sp. BSN-002]
MRIPHLGIVVFFSVAALAAYGGFSLWVVLYSGDVALTGDTVGTWKSFAVAVIAFWIGSSSAGKAKHDSPSDVTVVNPPDNPVPVEGQ